MGNGRLSGRSAGKSSARNAGSSLVWLPVFGAVFVLLLAGCVLLASSSRRHAENALAQVPVSPIPAASGASSFPRSSLNSKSTAHSILGQLPLMFEPNQGQADPRAKFLARGAGYSLFLDQTGAVLAMQTAHSSPRGRSEESLRMTLVGGNPSAAIAGINPLPGKTNYFLGSDPNQWHTRIPQFAGVHYENVYPGINLVFYGNQGHLEYDFQVAPGADPSRAELQFDGATKLELSGGDLILTGTDGGVRLQAPRIYQRAGDRQQAVEGHFVLRASNRVGFEIEPYDRGRELIIDPELIFSSYFGGSGAETSPSVAVNPDGDGFIYLVGTTTSPQTTFPAAGVSTSLPSTLSIGSTAATHIFIAKINPANPPSVVYETFMGSAGSDSSIGIAVDSGSNVYVVGNTTSTGFPTVSTNRYQGGPEAGSTGTSHIFVSELSGLDPTGATLKYSSYLSGNGTDVASGMAVDTNGDVFLTGTTTSTDAATLQDAFPATFVPAPFQSSPRAAIQFFMTKINTNAPGVAGIAYSTYFGGGTPSDGTAVGGGIAVDTTGNAYFSGTTNFFNSGESQSGSGGGLQTDFPILNAYQPCLDTPAPSVIAFPLQCIAPATTPFPTDAFVAKINPNGAQTGAAQLIFSTYLGGTAADSSSAITIDSANIYITGSTTSSDIPLPTGSASFQECLDTPVNPTSGACPAIAAPVPTDAYVARLSNPVESPTTPAATALTYFSYLGGSGNDSGLAIAVDTASGALVTGTTASPDFPATLPNPIQGHLATGATQNAFLAHIDTTTITGQAGLASFATFFGGSGTDRGTSITVDPSLNTYFAGDTTSSTEFETVDPIQATLNGASNAFVVKLGTAADLCITCVPPTASPAGPFAWAGNQVALTFTVSNNGPDLATNITVLGTGAPYTSATAGSGTCSTPSNNSVACTIPTLQSGATAAATFNVTPTIAGSFSPLVSVSSFNNNDPDPSNNTTSFSLTASTFFASILPNSQTVPAGNTAVYSVLITPNPVFGASVTLGCSSVPVGAACNFTSSSISLNGGTSGSTTLNLTTTARPVTTVRSRALRGPVYAFWLMVPGMALLGLGAGGKRLRRRSWLLGFLALSTLFALVLLQPACSSSKTQPTVSGTPAGSYSVTITATSGTFTQSAPFNLTVQ